MSAPIQSNSAAPLDLSRWRSVPGMLILVGGLLTLIGALFYYREFNYAWLVAFMFFLSLGLGGWLMVIFHHIFDASWSVPIRRFCEHLACLLPIMAVMFIPIALNVLFAKPANQIFHWIAMIKQGETDHSLSSKYPMFTIPSFFVIAIFNFAVWTFFARGLRYWSLKQDETGSVECTHMMRRYALLGVFFFAMTTTLAAIMWMKALQHEWFSTMYGVYYFAGSIWLTIYTVYVLTALLNRQGYLRPVVTQKTFYFIGSLMFAFTVFYAYITFFQYFIIWNANVPEEGFFYVLRERGTWWWVSMVIIFGHFFLPFLLLLRIDIKLTCAMIPIGLWAWLMHFTDMSFNILPIPHPEGFPFAWLWLDLGCMMFIGGVLARVFIRNFNAHPPFPQKDPRIAESLDRYVPADDHAHTAPAAPASAQGGGH